MAAGLDNHQRSLWRIKHAEDEEKSDLEFRKIEMTNSIQIYKSWFSTELF